MSLKDIFAKLLKDKDKKGMMKLIYLKQMEKERVKIDKVEDYYEFFVKMLKVEEEELHTYEHFWILGIDERGFAVCGYIVTLGYANFSKVKPMKIFKVALQLDAVKIIICQSKPNKKELEANLADLDITNALYHKAEILGLELIDHIIISSLSLTSPVPLFYSYLEHHLIVLVAQDTKYKSVEEARPELDKEKQDAVDDALKVREEQIIVNMLDMNIDVENIMKATGLSKKIVEGVKACIENAERASKEEE